MPRTGEVELDTEDKREAETDGKDYENDNEYIFVENLIVRWESGTVPSGFYSFSRLC